MADAADRAAERTELFIQASLSSRPKRPVRADDGTDCMSCGEEIPEERRRTLPGCCLCVDCQEDAEKVMGR
jgi:phage/conjugal plasmid C-4 type zinc finger TraR family protein